MEGPGIVVFEDGWMDMALMRPQGADGHMVYWCLGESRGRYVAECEVQRTSDYGLCIICFFSKGENGEDVLDPGLAGRNGIFRQYANGNIVSYHVSYYANTPCNPGRMASHLRKNNHFCLVDNGPPGIPPGSAEPHKTRLIKDWDRTQFPVDGRVIIDFVDDGERYGPIRKGRRIGLRQIQWVLARCRNLRVRPLENVDREGVGLARHRLRGKVGACTDTCDRRVASTRAFDTSEPWGTLGGT